MFVREGCGVVGFEEDRAAEAYGAFGFGLQSGCGEPSGSEAAGGEDAPSHVGILRYCSQRIEETISPGQLCTQGFSP